MERIGRNDPCPCGSGKKFKKCCQPRMDERSAFLETLNASAVPLMVRLARYAESTAGVPLEAVAREDFPFWRGARTRAQGARALDHLLFEPRSGSGGRIAARFADDVGNGLDAAQRALLARWIATPRRVYRVSGSWLGFTDCVDLLEEAAPVTPVYDIEEEWRPAPGMVVALRALPVAAGFFCAGTPVGFGARSPEDVVEHVRARHLDFVRSERIVSIDEYLRLRPTAIDEEAARRSGASSIILPG